MTDRSEHHVGEIAAITLVIGQLLARLPQSEQDDIRALADTRLRALDTSDETLSMVAKAAAQQLDALFKVIPRK